MKMVYIIFYYKHIGDVNIEMLILKVNSSNIDSIKEKLNRIGKNSKKEMKTIINNTAKATKKQMVQQAKNKYVKPNQFQLNKNLKLQKASVGKLCATLTSSGQLNGVIKFDIRESKKKGISAKVLKASSMEPLTKKGADRYGTDLKAFIITIKGSKNDGSDYSHTGVFQREPSGVRHKRKKGVRQPKDKIKQLLTTSVPKFYTNAESFKVTEKYINDTINANIQKMFKDL